MLFYHNINKYQWRQYFCSTGIERIDCKTWKNVFMFQYPSDFTAVLLLLVVCSFFQKESSGTTLSRELTKGKFEQAGVSVRSRMKLRVVSKKIYDYVRYDLKEIAFPSSLPDPPNIKKRRKLTLKEHFLVLKEATRLYGASWVRDIGPELRPYAYKKKIEDENEHDGSKDTSSKEKDLSMFEDLAVAARGGMETLRPALQRVYMTRASAYRDALKNFIQGYQEGIQQVMEKKEDSKSQREDDRAKGSG